MRFRLIESIDAEVDSEGNKLTPKQSQYFRDSKVRDHKGNLLVCYHGTENTFDTFEKGDIGFHFGTESAANQRREYKDNPDDWYVDKYYLNIENYIDAYDFGDWDGLTVAQHILESRLLDLNDEEIRWLQVISSSGGYYDESTTKQVRDFLISKGIDGFMYENAYEDAGSLSFIVFSPNQVKRITNQSPTSSNNLNEDVNLEDFNTFENHFYRLSKRMISALNSSDFMVTNGYRASLCTYYDFTGPKRYWLGVFAKSCQRNKKHFPIGINYRMFYDALMSGKLCDEYDVEMNIEDTIYHEVGHGLYNIHKKELINMEEEDVVEEFAMYVAGNAYKSALVNIITKGSNNENSKIE